MKKIKKIIKAIKNRDLIYKSYICFSQLIGFSNDKIKDLELRNKKFINIRKKYKIKKEYSSEEYKEKNLNVWILWLQGLEDAPKIVKKCVQNIYKYLSNYDIHIITAQNYMEYVSLPDFVVKNWKKGIISNTHFADIMRTELLIEHGGLWIDSTCYIMKEIPEYIFEKKLFMFTYKCIEDNTIKCNNWFIYSQPNNRTLKIIRDLLFEYWKKEKYLKEYFLWQFFATMAFEKYSEDYRDIYYLTDETPHYLGRNLLKKFDEEYWKILSDISFIYKLNYKFDKSLPIEGTYLEYIYKN